MNRRILKKLSKKAVPILIERFHINPANIAPSDGSEACYAPTNIERRQQWHDFLHPGPLKGTPMVWSRTSWEVEEWDCEPAHTLLQEYLFWEKFEPTAEDLAA